MTEKVDVEKFMRFVVEELTDEFQVDEAGYLIDGITNERVVLRKKQVMIIKDKLEDPTCNILNPLNESLKSDVVLRWFYAQLTSTVIRRISLVFGTICDSIHDEDAVIPSAFQKKFSKDIAQFDKACCSLVDDLHKDPFAFLNINYMRKTRTSTLRCALYEPDHQLLLTARGKMPPARKKAVRIVRECMSTILGLSDDETGYSESSTSLIAPKLESFLLVLNKLYGALNEAMLTLYPDGNKCIVDLTDLGYHITNLETYYKRTKWFTGNIIESETPVATPAVAATPATANNSWQNAGAPVVGVNAPQTAPAWQQTVQNTKPTWRDAPAVFNNGPTVVQQMPLGQPMQNAVAGGRFDNFVRIV